MIHGTYGALQQKPLPKLSLISKRLEYSDPENYTWNEENLDPENADTSLLALTTKNIEPVNQPCLITINLQVLSCVDWDLFEQDLGNERCDINTLSK